MKRPKTSQDELERLRTRAAQALERLAASRARLRVREKRNERTRHYRLGLVLETFLFEQPELLIKIEEVVRRESPRVRAAFALNNPPSWFEKPERDDPKNAVDTRRVRLGMALQRLLQGDQVLSARVQTLVHESTDLRQARSGNRGARHRTG